MEKAVRKAVSDVVAAVSVPGVHRATKYLSDKLVVRATRQRYSRKTDVRNGTVFLTMGRPNYACRKFIKACKKAGEPFPVRKVQLQLSRGR